MCKLEIVLCFKKSNYFGVIVYTFSIIPIPGISVIVLAVYGAIRANAWHCAGRMGALIYRRQCLLYSCSGCLYAQRLCAQDNCYVWSPSIFPFSAGRNLPSYDETRDDIASLAESRPPYDDRSLQSYCHISLKNRGVRYYLNYMGLTS